MKNIITTGEIFKDNYNFCKENKPITIVIDNNNKLKICNKCLHLKLKNKEWYIEGAKI